MIIKYDEKTEFDIVEDYYEKFGIDNLDDYEVIKNASGEADLQHKRYKRKHFSVLRCSICGKYFIGSFRTSSHMRLCFSMRNPKAFREDFYNSSYGDLGIQYSVIEEMQVAEMLKQLDGDYSKYIRCPGVWALWDGNKCIQVAKNTNIGREIWCDFKYNDGSRNVYYPDYIDKGTIVIVSDTENSFLIEAKYARDNRADSWNASFMEIKMLKKTISMKYCN